MNPIQYLAHPFSMPRLPGLGVPEDLYWILQEPAPLAGMRMPRSNTPWEALHEAGFKHVANLTSAVPWYDPSPLKVAFAQEMQDLYGGLQPTHPKREERLVHEALKVLLPLLQAGEGVVVHCYGGRGRTGTVLGCALRSLGYPSEEILAGLDRVHKLRGKAGWPESKWQAELVRRYSPPARSPNENLPPQSSHTV